MSNFTGAFPSSFLEYEFLQNAKQPMHHVPIISPKLVILPNWAFKLRSWEGVIKQFQI